MIQTDTAGSAITIPTDQDLKGKATSGYIS